MKRHYIFLVLSIILGLGIIYLGVGPKESEIHTIEQHIEKIKVDNNTTMEYANDVLDGVIEQNNKIHDLDGKVKDSEVTIEEQVIELKKLLKQANEYKKMANENANQALLMKEMSIKQKKMAEVARKVTEEKLIDALNVIEQLKSDKKELNNIIESLQKIELDTISIPTIIKEGKVEKSSKKKKKD